MADPLLHKDELAPLIKTLSEAAESYFRDLDGAPVRSGDVDSAAEAFIGALPEDGKGGGDALETLLSQGLNAHIRSSGPRFFHFVIGGVTPAAFAAEWFGAVIDQNPGLWAASPLGAELEEVALEWLRDLFELPDGWKGTLTTGGTMANYVGLAAGRRWWGLRYGVDVEDEGLSGLPPLHVFSSGHIHASAYKVLAMLGVGRSNIHTFAADGTGRLDVDGMETALRSLNGGPALIHANAGEVNAGHFDPIDRMADLSERFGCWLHVDGAFGLFARLSDRSKPLTDGIERADSVSSDAHKWLNVPYDCGFTLLRDPTLLSGLFATSAAYLGSADDPRPNPGFNSPESSQKARGLAVWATLYAYGRTGYRAMVERHLDLAQRVARRVDEAPDLELLSDVPLNIVCFRYRPPGVPEERLDALNAKLGEEVLLDGRVYFGTTRYDGKTAFRPAIVNWRTTEADVDLLVDVVRELGQRIST